MSSGKRWCAWRTATLKTSRTARPSFTSANESHRQGRRRITSLAAQSTRRLQPAPRSKLRVVQVGMGAWGRDWARLVIPEVRDVELVACVDSDARALALLQDQTRIAKKRCFASLDAALNAFQADAVLNTTTLPSHAPITRAALDVGLHILVEKPFTETLDCAQELVELAAARRLTLMVSQNYRFFPAVRRSRVLSRRAPSETCTRCRSTFAATIPRRRTPSAGITQTRIHCSSTCRS